MTIEERAKEYCESHYDGFNCNDIEAYKKSTIRDFIQGATDQQKIDIEKAWSHFKDIIKDYCLETGQEYEDLSMWYNEFRQAMEE